ncbi:scavenger receptor class F member 1-like [Haliotis asinina]|uniref:scavenger receptor class F member 1-like n=1 Tax=Haliotis asinina TaxID=109174 RepID=UPI003531DFCE
MSKITCNRWVSIHRYTMTVVMGLLLFGLANITLGARCRGNQQCSDCDDKTTRCLTQCYAGYFGDQCRSVCSSHCRNSTCQLIPRRGIGRCTEGCEPGYQGSNCIRPCDTHTVPCTPCPGGCDGEYCHNGRKCHDGCKHSFYGLECKNCSDKCRVCNRKTGKCEECHPSYFGDECEHSCENCVGSCKDGCTNGCVAGFYGPFCTQICSKRCRPPNTSHTAEDCRGDAVVMGNCTPECHNQSGDCTHGCVDGWYGSQCSSPCNPDCRQRRCSNSGDCIEGCVGGRWGSDYDGCQLTVNCTSNATVPEELARSFNASTSSTAAGGPPTVAVTLTVLVVVVILVASSCFGLRYYRRRFHTRQHLREGTPGDTPRRRATPSAGYQELELYWEIRDEDIDLQCSPYNKDVPDADGDTEMLVLADCYPGGDDDEVVDGDDTTGTSKRTSKDYTHLQRGVVLDAKMVISYISPVDDQNDCSVI